MMSNPEYNVSYSDKVHKYSINIPLNLLKDSQIRATKAGFEEYAPYLRALIAKDCNSGIWTLQDVLNIKEYQRREIEENIKELSPKKIGFVKLSIKRISNIISPKQQIFDWGKNN